MNPQPVIALIGAGNLGAHLGRRLTTCGMTPVQVFSRSEEKARSLGEAIGAAYTHSLHDIQPDADIYLIAVRDDAIAEVAEILSKSLKNNPLVLHTSGATPSSILAPYFQRYGVFYPLQTFTTDRTIDFEGIPICIYTQAKEDIALLQHIAARISTTVHEIDDAQRATLHVAAVFVNNFVNHMYRIGRSLLEEKNLQFELLLPLIWETAQKVQAGGDPGLAQTGPARRGDVETVRRHLDYLRQHPAYQVLYRQITASINPNTFSL